MSTASVHELPPLRTLQTALRRITETLATALAHPAIATPDWSESDWLLARAVATIHGVSPLLSRSLHWQGPPGWQQFLEDQRTHTERRHARIRGLLVQLRDVARRADIPLLALKGAALHALQIYAPGERPMADVDLLVREHDSRRAGQMLEGLGFELTQTSWRHQVFVADGGQAPAAFGENVANSLKVELHSHIREMLPLRFADITALVFAPQAHAGLNDYPSRAVLMTHLLLHAAGAMAFRAVRLINLNDIARLAATMSSRDWDELLAQEASLDQTLWWSFPPLALTARYYDSIPERVIDAMSLRCQWWLKRSCQHRTLSDLSLSHLWITAFPGIEWARSPREMLGYIRQRVVPSAELKSLRAAVAKAQPSAAETPWAQMPQGRRIVRWLTSRPARAESLFPIRTALAQWE